MVCRSWAVAWSLFVGALLITGTYLRGAWLNYRHVLKVFERGRCMECGYDLRGTILAAGWECPECGERVSPGMAERVRRASGKRGSISR